MTSGSGTDWGEDTFAGDSSSQSITLTMRQGPNPGQRFIVRKGRVTVGRLPDNDISIPDTQVSRHHASIAWEDGQFLIRDLNSANGTSVNGAVLTGPAPLRDGDVIGLGEIVLTFQGSTGGPEMAEEGFYQPDTPVVKPRRPAGTVAMTPPPKTSSGSIAWPVLVGIALALFLALAVVVAIVALVLSQGQSVPEIRVQQPLSGSQVKTGQQVLVLASATDHSGVARVEMWVDGALNATINSPQPGGQPVLLVQQPWVPTKPGIHNLSLKAYNSAGRASEPIGLAIGVTESGGSQSGESTPQPPTATATMVVVNQPSPTPISVIASSPTSPLCVNDSAFVADVTVPDNTIFQPGGRIDKTWRIRNSGNCPWESGYRLVFTSGNKMGAPDNQPVVPTAPGGTTDVTVTMYAPSAPGVYTGIWRMVDVNGEPFGQRFSVVIQVPSPFTPTPAVTPTFTPRPGPLIELTVDRDRVSAGECTRVRARVEGVTAAWLDGEAIVGGYKEKEVCPCEDTRYTVDATVANGDHVTKDVKVSVDGSCVVDKPDLLIRDLVADNTSPRVGESIHLRMRVKNQGSQRAKNFAVAWRPLGSDSSPAFVKENITLEPGEHEWIEWDYTYKEDGKFKSRGEVDYLDKIDESDEGNNTKTLTMEVEPKS
jgi:hypothetical protein